MSEKRHLHLCYRKALSGRARVLQAMAAGQAAAFDGDEGQEYAAALDQALVFVTTAATAARSEKAWRKQDLIPLDSYLRQASLQVLALPQVGNPALAPGLQAAGQLLAGVNCQACAGGPNVCNNLQERDDDLVDGKGLCLNPFRDLFDFVRRETENCYNAHVPGFASFPPPAVSFRTAFSHEPHTFPVARFVGGKTEHLDAAGRLLSAVTLYAAVEEFDLESLLAAGYVLFHECVCHAYNGARPGAGGRVSTEPEDRFAEGWMDWVAMQVYQRAVKGARSPLLTEEALDQGEALRHARCDIGRPGMKLPDRQAAAPRLAGTQAAQRFQDFLRRRYADPALAWDLFLQVSLDWNVERDLAPRRGPFVQMVNSCLGGPIPDFDREKWLADRVEAYRAKGQLSVF